MTDANLMDAPCKHGVTWWECEDCDREIERHLTDLEYREPPENWEP